MCSIQQKFSSIQHMAPLEFPNRNIQFLSVTGTEIAFLLGKLHHISAFVTKGYTEEDVSATVNFRDIKK
jgi:hypothetical protein